MTLHTILPLEVVLQGFHQNNEHKPTIELHSGNMKLELEPVYPGIGKIVRIIECPLNHYLRPELSPGMLYTYGPQLNG
ncbi:YlzJ-like family protein [Paenibacillus tarimensis]|uniref:YlzJ-like family protein n=1 Tax=Paenibacillus tarimensis TaxID=416012 RepID=UPI001F1BD645|nr:YlzJ-like family protein [Paenibacillus tarimensis]MCF2942367.1 YlzJ-like family protein [Paenibacillus tarimensis]